MGYLQQKGFRTGDGACSDGDVLEEGPWWSDRCVGSQCHGCAKDGLWLLAALDT